MNCKHCDKPKKEHFHRHEKRFDKGKRDNYYCKKYGIVQFQLENCCDVCGVETHKFPDGQYICSDCRYNQERRDTFPEEEGD